MKKKNETFASLLNSFAYRYDLRPVFDDFLTMALCAFSQNPLTGKSHDEDLYMATIATYANDDLHHLFPQMLTLLIVEMEQRIDSSEGNDVLGEYYQEHLYRKGASQYFTPWHVCELMAECMHGDAHESEEPLRVLDPCCGSGRTLLAAARKLGWRHRYYGIDIDHTCVKMTAINLFLNGVFHAEIMCADALLPDDFRMSYRFSFVPFGVFRVHDKEHSLLWKIHNNAFAQRKEATIKQEIVLSGKDEALSGTGSQLQLF
jgi:type I restriction-modification system DNA methylase subunit